MVFVIQNAQNRDTAAMHIKIDELIRVTQRARNVLLDLEELDDKRLEALREDYEKLARRASPRLGRPCAPKKFLQGPQPRNHERASNREAVLSSDVGQGDAISRFAPGSHLAKRRGRHGLFLDPRPA